MASFIQLTRENGTSILFNVDRICDVWTQGGNAVLQMVNEAWMVKESYDEVVALISLAGHNVEDRSATEIIDGLHDSAMAEVRGITEEQYRRGDF